MLAEILHHLVSDAEFVIHGEPANQTEYAENVIWLDHRAKPTWAEIEANRPNVQTVVANKVAEQARANAYRIEADPLFFGYQRGENTEQEWLDKVAEIRARHPYA